MTAEVALSGGLRASARPLQEEFDVALLDLDGVVYVGPAAVAGAADALAGARAAGMRLRFVTNNASRPAEVVAVHLTELGVTASTEEVATSAQAAAALLAERHPPGSPILVVGGEGLRHALRDCGLTPVASMQEQPVAVVQGFSPEVGWPMLAEGTRAVRAGLPWLATNRDLTFPTVYGPAPGNGALVAAISLATGVQPEVAGKPEPTLFRQAARHGGAQAPLVVGDRLDTDLQGARAAGMPGLLVLTGVSTARDALLAPADRRPHFVGADLSALSRRHPATTADGDGWRCGQARVQVRDGALTVLQPGPDRVDLLRAGCAAAWEAADTAPERRLELDGLLDILAAGREPPTWAR